MDIIFDIDGCLADNSKRLHHIMKSPKDWESFNAGILGDTPISPMIHVLMALRESSRYNRIIIVTARCETQLDDTKNWLVTNQIHYNALYMRTRDDYRNDDIIKLEILAEVRRDGYDPKLAFEDRTRVVNMWRDKGLICCQTASGDF